MIGKQLGIVLSSALLLNSNGAVGGIPNTASDAPAPPVDRAQSKAASLTLRTTRTIAFDSNEGTWMSLDVSPDGAAIVFELLGDIYTLPIAGGEAKPVLTGPAFDSQPHFSPDGSRIVLVSDRSGAENIWISKADGSDLKQITKQTHGDIISPAFTPDGRYVVAARDSNVFGGRELWLYDLKGGSGIQLTKAGATPQVKLEDQLNIAGPVASPDGRYLYYSERHGLIPYDAKFPLWQIARRDRQTGEEEVITDAQGSAIRPLLSPDGNTLVFGTRIDGKTGLKVRDLRTGDERWLKIPIDRDEQEALGTRDLLPGYAFTPDGRSVIVSYDGRIHRISIDGATDQIIPFTAHVSQALGPLLNFPERIDQGPVVSRLAQDPKLSPNGMLIAYSGLAHIYIAGPRQAAPRRLTRDETPAFQPTWSPDGRSIAYVTWDRTGGALWRASADGTTPPKRLTRTPAYYSHPVFSPDGSTIVALRSSVTARDNRVHEFSLGPAAEPLTDIIALKQAQSAAASSDAAIRVIAPARDRSDPQFTGDPDRLYLSSGRGLVSIRLDGSDERIAVKVSGLSVQGQNESEPATELRVSPNGRSALALVNHQVRLLSLPAFGGAAPEVDVSAPSESLERLSINGADSIGWAPDGGSVFWSLGATLFRLPLSALQKDDTKPSAAPGPNGRPDYKPEMTSLAVTAARSAPHGDLLLRGARVITMRGDEVLENADLWIHDNRIAAIGGAGTLTVPAGAEIIQLDGATIIPGIIDVHAHWLEIRRSVLDLDSWPLLANLAYGVTAGRDPQTFTNDIFAYQDLIDTGQMIGPRTYSTGPGVFHEVNLQSEQDAEDTLQRYKTYYRTNLIKSYEVGNRQQRQWIVEASEKLRMMPTTEGGMDTRLELTHILDGFSGNEHNLPQVPLYNDVVSLFARSGTTYTPTLLVNYGGPFAQNFFFTGAPDVHDDAKIQQFFPHAVLDSLTNRRTWVRNDEYIFPQIAAQAAKIVRAGGRVAVGGHGVMQGLQCHWEMWALASGGMSNLEVIRSATLSGAEAIGLAQDLGSIEPGKLADLVVLNANPLQDIHNTNTIRLVMKNGQLFKGDDLSEVWPAKRPGPRGWWLRENDELRKAEELRRAPVN